MKIIQTPKRINSAPAPIRMIFGGINRVITEPPMTPSKEVSTSAVAAPRNTAIRESVSAAKLKVASWVLSPNSARNIIPNVVSKTLKSILASINRMVDSLYRFLIKIPYIYYKLC